jgi:hypothetical protein
MYLEAESIVEMIVVVIGKVRQCIWRHRFIKGLTKEIMHVTIMNFKEWGILFVTIPKL